MLRHFVDAARRRFVMSAIEMIERAGTFADGKAIFDGLSRISFRKHHGFAQRPPEASCAAIAEAKVQPDPCVCSVWT